MSQLVPQQFGAVSSVFQNHQVQNSDLAANVSAGFGIIGYRGKVWSIRHRGEERNLMRDDGDGPRNSIEIVILKASPNISKIWYEAGYQPGASAPPDCFSTNGVTPDVGAQKKQSAACATCPKNAWGSRITESGKQGKACSDSRRLCVVPLADIRNEVFGGPMLLRVPAASLNDLATFGNAMQKMGYPYNSIGIRIAFDPNEAFPKFVFSPIRPLTDDEARLVIEMAEDPGVSRVLAEGMEHTAAPVATAAAPTGPNTTFEQPGQPAAAFQQPQPSPAPQPTVAPQPQPAPAPQASGFGPIGSGGAPAQPAAEPAKRTRKAAQPAAQPAPTQASGFGPMAGAAPSQPSPATPGTTPSKFEEDFDAKLDALMG